MLCRPAARQRVTSAIDDLEAVPCVVEPVDLIPPGKTRSAKWEIEVTIDTDLAGRDGVPPTVLGIFAEYGLWERENAPRGSGWRSVAVVE